MGVTVPSRAPHGVPYDPRLTDEVLAQLRGMLEQQRRFRIDQLAQLDDPRAAGRLGSTHPQITLALTSAARAALRDVQHALWRMDEGRYGACTGCGEPQPLERLEILPQVALCMGCQRTADSARDAAAE